MKYRRLPFGYGYSEGKIMIDPKESKIITEIVQMYLERFSLMSIAQALTARKIEIAPGLTDWNKARVMHLLADERYLGNERFPQIIDKGTFEEIKAIRQEKNCRAEWNADADVFKLSPPVQCPCCKAKMQRKHDSRCRQKIRWLCTNRECGEIIPMPDEILIGGVSKIVNSLANNPENVQIPLQAQVQQTKDIMQKRNEIRRALDGQQFDEEKIRRMIVERVCELYSGIPDQRYISMGIQNEFRKHSSEERFPVDLIDRTVRSVSFSEGGKVLVVLKNGQVVKEERYGAER